MTTIFQKYKKSLKFKIIEIAAFIVEVTCAIKRILRDNLQGPINLMYVKHLKPIFVVYGFSTKLYIYLRDKSREV